ncbi:lysine N(6)-hydroxylase/L-ornithine N(5)-oxygenase family protein [Solwaraspora sp. WMMB335]|uniref:lysine N(6)-hydroxylase/L-ornithine N(5)-oxygenase family protein n=1 Tax=Solwaraspora sp. WMMB335 TaxID=3404118 RepID=UPI003B942F4C
MPPAVAGTRPPVHDLVGVGFGPSNLALAIAVAEHNAAASRPLDARFLERQPRFGWHRGMLLDDATMQVSFLKDLVTMRNPTSMFSFLAYLHCRGRLVDFINHKTMFPLRAEFHDYFEWAAEQVDDQVSYRHQVTSVRPVTDGTGISYLDVQTMCSDQPASAAEPFATCRTRNLVLAPGLRPWLPDGVVVSPRIWHTEDLLDNVPRLGAHGVTRLIVVGAGQSAAEATAYLHERFPRAEICGVFARYGYTPADDSPFANRIFDPAAIDDYFVSPEPLKQRLMGYHRNTNYSVVDLDLIQELYRRAYQEKVRGTERLRMFNLAQITETVPSSEGVRTVIESLATGNKTVLDADAVVYATGYRPVDPAEVLGELDQYVVRDSRGRPVVSRDYRLVTDPAVRCGIYLQGGTEHSHGLTSSLLSATAVRVGEILQSVLLTSDASISSQAARYDSV